jgi:urea carboxylase
LVEYERFLARDDDDVTAFRQKQQAAYAAEVALWQNDAAAQTAENTDGPAHHTADGNAVLADMSGNVWKVLVEAGQQVEAGEPLVILEAMKMEFQVAASKAGTVAALYCKAGKSVAAGDALLMIEASSDTSTFR